MEVLYLKSVETIQLAQFLRHQYYNLEIRTQHPSIAPQQLVQKLLTIFLFVQFILLLICTF